MNQLNETKVIYSINTITNQVPIIDPEWDEVKHWEIANLERFYDEEENY